MLFTDEDLFGGHQTDIFEALAEITEEAVTLPAAGVDYGDEPGHIDLFGAGQLVLGMA